MCLNGLNVLLPQAIFAVLNIGVSILLKVYLTRQLDLAGLAWGGALSTLVLTVLPCGWLCWRTLRDLDTRPSTAPALTNPSS
jgi:Na+-driven multidrug efflux pump